MTCVCVRLYEITSVTKVHKWTSSSHGNALKLSGPQVDEFIIKSTNGQVHPIGMPSNYQVHKWMSLSHRDALKLLDEFIQWGCLKIIKSTSGQVYY